MIYLQIFWVFFVANILGYGGGPSIVPLIEHEVVAVYGWMCSVEFAEIFAMGNALPGPIAPKMAAFIGFEMGGVLGAFLGLVATIGPSVVLMILMMGLLKRYKDSPQVQRLTRYIRPTIAVLIGEMAVRNLIGAWTGIGPVHLLVLVGVSLLCLTKLKVHPAFMVLGALIYGAIFLGY
ncbi:MAG: chromate transporter [Defluviitaleaceae bacterium]|nr:chromate transporter [Defluviitaleaceae bacterium]